MKRTRVLLTDDHTMILEESRRLLEPDYDPRGGGWAYLGRSCIEASTGSHSARYCDALDERS